MIFTFSLTLLRTMASKYYQQHPERSQFADAGIMIAFAVIVVTAIKLAIYGLTMVSLAWFAIAVIYMAVAAASKPRSALRAGVTAFFMVLSVGALFASFLYDYPITPKKESVIKADKEENNNNNRNRQIKVETPKPVAVETDVVSEDASSFEEVEYSQQPVDYTPEIVTQANDDDEEEVEIIDLSAGSASEDILEDRMGNDSPEDILEEHNNDQFDESFK